MRLKIGVLMIGQYALRLLGEDDMAGWKTTANKWLYANTIPTVRAVTKWYFDLIKNALVVAALVYTWKKTDDAIVRAVAILTFAMFLSYIISYPLAAIYAMRTYVRSLPPLLALLIAILSAMVILGSSSP